MTKALTPRNLSLWAAALLAAGLALLPVPGLDPVQARTAAVVLLTLAFWATGAVPPYLASLILFAALLIPGLAAPDLVFSGFGSAAVWLIISGFVIGAAITASGLGGRLAAFLAPVLTGSYPRLVGGLTLVAMLLGFLMPSSVGRAVVLMPIGMALADRVGFEKGSNGRIGIAVALAIACNMPSFAILPSNIPNMILAGAAETIHGARFGYTEYLLLHYPVLGIVKSALTIALVLRLFPDRLRPEAALPATETARKADPRLQLRTALVLLATLALWMTDGLHGINPAWISIATAVVLMAPRIGVVDPQGFRGSVDFGTVLFVAGALALGAVVNGSGLGTLIGAGLEAALPLAPGRDLVNFVSLSLMSLATGLVATVPAVPAVLTPMAQDLAAQSGFTLGAVLMTQVIGFSTVIFPYQVGPLLVAMQMSGERLSALLRITLPLALLTVIILLPVDYLWWKLLGWI